MAREPQDAIAWSNVLRQHHDRPRTEGFFRAFYGPVTAAAAALDAIRSGRSLDDSSGARLDLIGSIVGVTRDVPNGLYIAYFGFGSQPAGRPFSVARMRREGEPIALSYTAGDAEYRSLIRAKIALNNGHGTAPEIAAALRAIFRVKQVSVRDVAPGEMEAWIGRIPQPDEVTGDIVQALLPRAAGVKLSLTYFSPAFFGFQGQPGATGFGQGPLARTSTSNLNPL